MKRTLAFLVILATLFTLNANDAYTVIANPGEDASRQIRINWHSDNDNGKSHCFYTISTDTAWTKAKKAKAKRELCTAYDSMYSKTPAGENIYENATFIRNTVDLKKLKPGTKYMFRIGNTANEGDIHYFKTAPAEGQWTAAIISDFHAYTPIPARVESAMAMLGTLQQQNKIEFDIILHAGDIIAWGGSYSFWKDLYKESFFKNYLWAGVNGNHDNMDRTNKRNTNNFFKYANNNPHNGYKGEKGVCYHFTYGNTLFIMLNNESMRSDEGLAAAQEWVRKVIKSEKNATFVIVMEHYQWFFGTSGKTSEYKRWKDLFDECGVDLAIGANNHIYARTNALLDGKETNGETGTVYLQTPSADNERGLEADEWTDNKDIIKFRWTEGEKTVGALLMKADNDNMTLTLYDRHGKTIDTVAVKAKKK